MKVIKGALILFWIYLAGCAQNAPQDTRQFPSASQDFEKINALMWRPNRLAVFSCSAAQITLPNPSLYKYPTYMAWQTDGTVYADDKYKDGFGLTSEAINTLDDKNIQDPDEVLSLLPIVSPIFQPIFDSGSASYQSGKSPESGWAYRFFDNSSLFVDEGSKVAGAVGSKLASRGQVKLNKMAFTLPAGTAPFDKDNYMNLGFNFSVSGGSPKNLLHFSVPNAEAGKEPEQFVTGSALKLAFQGRAIEGNPISSSVIPFSANGIDLEETGEESTSYAHTWDCTRYFVTKPNDARCVKNTNPADLPEADSPLATGVISQEKNLISVRGYFGKYRGHNCFVPTDSENTCYPDYVEAGVTKKVDPITVVETNQPTADHPWVNFPTTAWRYTGQYDPQWLTVCKRITIKK